MNAIAKAANPNVRMKAAETTYRGFRIRAWRDQALGGWENLYYFIERLEDGWLMEDDFTSGSETPLAMVNILKSHVDDFHEHPEDYDL